MKAFLTIFFYLFLILPGFSQITIGPRLGVNFSKLNLGSPYETWKTGTVFGGVVNIPIKNDIAFQGEVLFSRKGDREEFDGENSYDELTSKYWEVPLLINYMYSAGQVNFFGNAGAYLAYWKSGSYESKIGENDVLVEDYEFTSTSDDDGFSDNRFDYGVAVGAGVLYDRVGTAGNIILEFRYTQGFAPVSTVENPPAGYTAGKNKAFSISLAYMLYL